MWASAEVRTRPAKPVARASAHALELHPKLQVLIAETTVQYRCANPSSHVIKDARKPHEPVHGSYSGQRGLITRREAL